jgi:hypothetical protein
MRSFGEKVGAGWVTILRSEATPIEKLDALSWVDINAVDRFRDEFRIQLAWMRQSPPDTDPGLSFTTRLRQLKALLSEGIRSGEIRIDSPSTEMLSRCNGCPGCQRASSSRGEACGSHSCARHGVARRYRPRRLVDFPRERIRFGTAVNWTKGAHA